MTTIATKDLKAAMPLINAARITDRLHLLDDCLLVSGDNGSLHIKTPLSLHVAIDGSGSLQPIVVSHEEFSAAVKSCGEVIALSRGAAGLVISSGGITHRLAAKPDDYADAFVVNSPDTNAAWFSVSGAALGGAINATRIAVSTKKTRYHLNGVYLHTEGAAIAAVATDDRRLVKKVSAADVFDREHTAIIPRDALPALRALCKGKGHIHARHNGERVIFSGDAGVIAVNRIDGVYLNYQRAITPAEKRKTWIAGDAAELLAAAKSMPGNKRSFGTCVVIDATTKAPTMAANGTTAAINVTASKGETEPRVGFNVRYLAEMLALDPHGAVRITFKDAKSPAVFEGADATLTRVLMPMRRA